MKKRKRKKMGDSYIRAVNDKEGAGLEDHQGEVVGKVLRIVGLARQPGDSTN